MIDLVLQQLPGSEVAAVEARLGQFPMAKRYREALRELHSRGGQDAVNEVVRSAVLRSRYDPARSTRTCDELEADIAGWFLPEGTAALGQLLAKIPARFGTVLTTNFDPLLSIAVRAAGGRVHRLVMSEDGRLDQVRTENDVSTIIHVHGFWNGDTLHTAAQLTIARPHLKASIRKLLRNYALVVVAYGGWDDILAAALEDHNLVDAAEGDILWAFFDDDQDRVSLQNDQILTSLNQARARGRFRSYGGVDCHRYFRELSERAKREMPRPRKGPPSQATPPRTAASSALSLASDPLHFMEQVYDFFGVRWEPVTATQQVARVFWPVRLRPPTLIHAAQAFLAGALQQRGVEIVLYLDDFGRAECAPDRFKETIGKHFRHIGASWEATRVVTAKEVVSAERLGATWEVLASWLARDGNDLRQVLDVCKLLSGDGNVQFARKPRKLMTPAVIWSCLHWDLEQNPLASNQCAVTLGGQDEVAQWKAWRDVFGDGRHVGHLYVPRLAALGERGDGSLVMAEEQGLHWESAEDIEHSLERDGSIPSQRNHLLGWLIMQCLIFPAAVQGRGLLLSDVLVAGPADLALLDTLPQADLRKAVVREAAKQLL